MLSYSQSIQVSSNITADDSIRPMQSNMLPRLPEELLQQIFSYLQPTLTEPYWESCSRANRALYRTLSSVCLVNKLCHRLAGQLLYRSVELYGANTQRDNDLLKVSGYAPNAQHFLRTLIQEPSLAAKTKQLKIENIEDKPGSRGSLLARDGLKDTVSALPISAEFKEVLLKASEEYVEDAEIALVLALVPNLEYLEITAVYDFDKTCCSRMIKELVDHEGSVSAYGKPLSKLREVAIRNMCAPGTDWGFLIDEVAPILRMPSLRTLRGYNMQVVGATDSPPEADTSYVEQVHIDTGVLDDNGIEVLFKACPAIRHLEFSAGNMIEWTLDFDTIGKQLGRYGRGLETLALRTARECGDTILEDLRPLDKLRFLTVTKFALLGHPEVRLEDYLAVRASPVRLGDVLPRSLETLELLGWDNHLRDVGYLLKSGVHEDTLGAKAYEFEKSRVYEDTFGGKVDDRDLIPPLLADARFSALSTIMCELENDLKVDVGALGWKQSRTLDGCRLILSRVASGNGL